MGLYYYFHYFQLQCRIQNQEVKRSFNWLLTAFEKLLKLGLEGHKHLISKIYNLLILSSKTIIYAYQKVWHKDCGKQFTLSLWNQIWHFQFNIILKNYFNLRLWHIVTFPHLYYIILKQQNIWLLEKLCGKTYFSTLLVRVPSDQSFFFWGGGNFVFDWTNYRLKPQNQCC